MGRGRRVIWEPNPGPQTDFLAATEFEVLYGGAAGGGKSDATLFGGLRYVDRPHYRALFLRKTMPELQEMIERSVLFRELGAEWNENKKIWRFPSGAVYEFGYFEQWKHHTRYQGQQYQYIAFDELGTVPEERFWTFLHSRCRSPRDPDILSAMRATANPGGSGHAWLKKRYIDKCGLKGDTVYVDSRGLSRRFIPARLQDNPVLMENDPQYLRILQSLPEIMRRQLLEGDWGASAGLALGELDLRTHLIGPDHPYYHLQPWAGFFGAFDWGFMHPASFGVFMELPGGVIVLADSLHLWRKTPLEIGERIEEKLHEIGLEMGLQGPLRLATVQASRDCFEERKARGENTPKLSEQFRNYGLLLVPANQARVLGLNNMRHYITTIGRDGQKVDPRFFVRDTVGNRHTFDVLEGMVCDPNDVEDALKVDADEYGEGGDDPYDMVRFGLARRLIRVQQPKHREEPDPNYDHQGDELIKKHPLQRKNRLGGLRRIRGW